MLKAKSRKEMLDEVKIITEKIKEKINCTKIIGDAYIKEIEDKCNKENQLDSGINLINEEESYIVRDFYYPGVDVEIINYYYFSEKPTKSDIEYARCLVEIHSDISIGKLCDVSDTEISTLRDIKRLRSKLFNEPAKKIEVGEMTEKMKMVFEAKKRLVEKGKSEVFNEYNTEVNVSKEDFIKALEWLEADPLVEVNERERISREVGFDTDGKVIYGKRYYDDKGDYIATYPIDLNLSVLDFPRRRLNKKDIL